MTDSKSSLQPEKVWTTLYTRNFIEPNFLVDTMSPRCLIENYSRKVLNQN